MRLLRVLIVGLVCVTGLCSDAQDVAPEHPVTEATLRRYFDVCHFGARNREQIDAQLAVQRRTLPEWYPSAVWDEIVAGIERLDVVPIALPVYQRYFSEDAAQNAIRLFLTPGGQAMVSKAYDEAVLRENAGENALVARQNVLNGIKAEEDAKVRAMMASMTPKEREQTEVFIRSAEWKRLNGLSGQIAKEFAEAYVAEQEKVLHEVSEKHRDELGKALRDYKAQHPGYTPEI